MSIYTTLQKLLPGGHAFRRFYGFQIQKLVEALADYPDLIRAFYRLVRDSGIPGHIPEDMLGEWETTYKLSGAGLTVAERNAQILATENAIGAEGAGYLENVLNDAFQGSITGYLRYLITAIETTAAWTAGNTTAVSAGQFESVLGEAELKIYEFQGDPKLLPGHLVIRSADDSRDRLEALTPDYYNGVFIISGPDGVGSWVDMAADREAAFIKKLLQIKPVSRWAILQINFV